MCHWTRTYDLFWAMFGGELGWLYVPPAARGRGIPARELNHVSHQTR